MATVAPVRYRLNITGFHSGQLKIWKAAEAVRFLILRAGRRWGKTRLGVAKCVKEALEDPGGYWWVTPTYDLAEEGWWVLREYERKFPSPTTRIEESRMRMWFPGGGYVQIRSADKPFGLRARGLKGVVLDEAAYLKPDAWPTLRAALADKQGWAWFITTPNSFNWFYQLEQKMKKAPGWKAFERPSSENPIMTDTEIEQLRIELGSVVFEQEILAKYVGKAGALFRTEDFRYWYPAEDEKGVIILDRGEDGQERVLVERFWRFQTVDTAASEKESASYFVIATWGVTAGRDLILIDRYREHAETTKHLPTLRAQYMARNPSYIGIEKAHVGIALVQSAIRAGLPVKPIMAERDKVSRARVAQARIESHSVFFPAQADWLPEWEQELREFPDGNHDDQVDVLAYAAIEVATGAHGKMRRGKSLWT